MQTKRSYRIPRMKVPNQKDSHYKKNLTTFQRPQFFNKIANSYSILQEFFHHPKISQTHRQFTIKRINTVSQRLKELSHPRTAHLSLNEEITKNKDGQKKQQQKIKLQRIHGLSQSKNPKLKPFQNEITACNLITTPIANILALKQKQQLNYQHEGLLSESENEEISGNHQQEEKKVSKIQIEKLKEDIPSWMDNIMKATSMREYQQFDKKLMGKVQFYRSKDHKISYQNNWR